MVNLKDYLPKGLLITLLLFFSLSVSVPAIGGEFYKWKDKKGNIFFSDTPPAGVNADVIPLQEEPEPSPAITPKVNSPRPGSGIAQKDYGLMPPKNEPTPSSVVTPKANPALPKSQITEEKKPYANINVIMYMTSWCGYCRKAREYIHSLRVNLVEHDIEKDPSKAREMTNKSGGSRGVPLIDVEGIIIRGYSPSAIKGAVEKRRSI